jgi:uncharacterized membrane protein
VEHSEGSDVSTNVRQTPRTLRGDLQVGVFLGLIFAVISVSVFLRQRPPSEALWLVLRVLGAHLVGGALGGALYHATRPWGEGWLLAGPRGFVVGLPLSFALALVVLPGADAPTRVIVGLSASFLLGVPVGLMLRYGRR